MIFGRNPDREKREVTAERNKFILKLQSQNEKLKVRITVLERALVASEQNYEQMKAAAQTAYRAMIAVELSDSSKREWDAAVRLLREALKEVGKK